MNVGGDGANCSPEKKKGTEAKREVVEVVVSVDGLKGRENFLKALTKLVGGLDVEIGFVNVNFEN